MPTDPSARLPLHALPWLPRPSPRLREVLNALPSDPLQALLSLQSLAQAGWGEADLRSIGRKVRAILKSAPSDAGSEARKAGLVPAKLLILSTSTASHIVDALIGTAI